MASALSTRQPPQHPTHWKDVPSELQIGFASFGHETEEGDALPLRRASVDHIRTLHCLAPLVCLKRGPIV